jgi:hypothetical protein
VGAALCAYREAGGFLRRLARAVGVPHERLSRIARDKGCEPSPDECARILAALPTAPLGRGPSRRLLRRLDECRPVDPFAEFARASYRFSHERDWMSAAMREREFQRVLALHDVFSAHDRRGQTTLSYRTRAGSETGATALYRREQRRRRAGLLDAPSPPSPESHPDTDVPPPCDISKPGKRVPPELHEERRAPGPWTPDRLTATGLSCPCSACKQTWPTVDDWWDAHNRALNPARRPARSRRRGRG